MAEVQIAAAPVPPGSVTAGAAFAVGRFNGFTVTLEGAFTGTYQLQISLDPAAAPAAASWINEGTALTAAGTVQCSKLAAWARWNCTAYTSTPPGYHIAGLTRL